MFGLLVAVRDFFKILSLLLKSVVYIVKVNSTANCQLSSLNIPIIDIHDHKLYLI